MYSVAVEVSSSLSNFTLEEGESEKRLERAIPKNAAFSIGTEETFVSPCACLYVTLMALTIFSSPSNHLFIVPSRRISWYMFIWLHIE